MVKNQKNIIGTNIKELRHARNETQSQTAKKLYISRSCLANYESGARIPQKDILQNLSNYFNVSTSDLFRAKF